MYSEYHTYASMYIYNIIYIYIKSYQIQSNICVAIHGYSWANVQHRLLMEGLTSKGVEG
jgi:hypothetical protein